MKKILTLLGAITIAGSGASTVISCSDNNPNNNKTDQGGFNPWDPSSWGEKQKIVFVNSYLASAKVFWINGVITDPYITLPKGTSPYTTNPDTIKAIKTALKNNNSNLSDDSLDSITLSKTVLQTAAVISVIAIINSGQMTYRRSLNVVLDPTDQQKADAIRAKISDVDLTVPASTNPDTTNPATITALKTALQKNNPVLDTTDLTKITFDSSTLTPGISTPMFANIRVGSTGGSRALIDVTLELPNQQKTSNFKTTANDNVQWSNWVNPSSSTFTSQKEAVEDAGQAVAGDDFSDKPVFSVYDENKNLIPDSSENPLATYLNNGVYL